MSVDYEKTYDDFWKEILEVDGVVDMDLVKRELHDYNFLLGEASKVYEGVSGGMISKPNTMAFEVISAYNESVRQWSDDQIREHVGQIIDFFESVDDDLAPQEVREELFAYLGIEESN